MGVFLKHVYLPKQKDKLHVHYLVVDANCTTILRFLFVHTNHIKECAAS